MRTTRRPGRTYGDVNQQLTQSDAGSAVPLPQPVRRPHGWEQREIQRQASAAAVAAVLGQMEAHLGGIRSLMLAPAPNDVLLQGTYQVGATEPFERSWREAFNAVTIANFDSTAILHVMSSPLSNNALPTTGAGVTLIYPEIERTIPMRGTTLSIQSTKGAITPFGLVVFSRPRDPMAGFCVG